MSDHVDRDLRDAADVLQRFQRVTVTEGRQGPDVKYIINGTLAGVLEEIASLFNRFHPLGYGTYCKSMGMQPGGKYEAVVIRYPSCD